MRFSWWGTGLFCAIAFQAVRFTLSISVFIFPALWTDEVATIFRFLGVTLLAELPPKWLGAYDLPALALIIPSALLLAKPGEKVKALAAMVALIVLVDLILVAIGL